MSTIYNSSLVLVAVFSMLIIHANFYVLLLSLELHLLFIILIHCFLN